MKYYYEFTLDRGPHLLGKRKENAQVTKVLGEIIPHYTTLCCTQDKFDDFRDVMYAIGFIISACDKYKVGSDGKKLANAPVKNA